MFAQDITIQELTNSLGLAPGLGVYRVLKDQVATISQTAPKEWEKILDFAVDHGKLNSKFDLLLNDLGPTIWGKKTSRKLSYPGDKGK